MSAFEEVFNSMKPGSRHVALVLAGLILVLGIAGATWVLSDRYETLFTAIEPQDAAAIISELERAGVPYELGEGGTRIAVPADKVHETRVKLMGSGVPLRGGVGFEIFDNSDFGMTEFAQKINYQRALEGELSRTIASLKEVKFARVHLVMPESSLFRKQQNLPSASVTLFLKQNATLDELRVVGIQRLVSAAVPGLDVNGVIVTDQNGVTLTRKVEQDQESEAATARLQKKQEIESYLKNKVVEVLERAVGRGRSIVSVDVTLNMNQVRTTREEVIPQEGNAGVLRRRESRTEAGKTSVQGGGVITETEYHLGRQVEQIVMAPGAIERLSIGVLVSNEVPAHRLEEIQGLVAMSVGLNNARGDAIAVFAAPFALESQSNEQVPLDDGVQPLPAVSENHGYDMTVDSPSTVEPISRHWLQQPQLMLGGAAISLVLLALLLAASKSRQPRRLRREERTLMLQKLEGWLQSEREPTFDKEPS